KKNNAFQCKNLGSDWRPIGQLVLSTSYGQAVEQSDGDVVVYSSDERLALGILERFKNNQSTRNILLDDYNYHGAGVVYNETTGRVYATQFFC
ncbi:MAG: hypothetical protein SXQ77_11145, partial [Halobacteria archaeon]|nr:hypothetical protein [Halobacteria archaeon]